MFAGYLLMLLLAAGAALAVFLPLWRTPSEHAPGARQSNLAVWRAQREEILSEAQHGGLNDAERDAALSDLTARAAEEIAEVPATTAPARPARAVAVVAALAVLVVAGALYARLGTPAALDAPAVAAAGAVDPQVQQMIDQLARRLESQPDDLKGWALLARAYMATGRYPDAVAAYQHAIRLAPTDADLEADYADALAMRERGRLDGAAGAAIARTLALDPGNLKGLELAGSAAIQADDYAAAIGYWERLRALLPPDSDDARKVADAVSSLRVRAASVGQKVPEVATTAAAGSPARAGVSGRVDVLPALAAKVALSDTVFVFARAANWQSGGPRMPLAVLRFPARELPKTFELTDAQAMLPGLKVSAFPDVVLEARISKSGRVEPAAGDLMSAPLPTHPGSAAASLIIDKVVQ